jgi:hypothetical protein
MGSDRIGSVRIAQMLRHLAELLSNAADEAENGDDPHFLILPSPRQKSRRASHETNPRNVSRTGKSPVASTFSILRTWLGQACRLPP